ncbi:hypothetical protein CMO89_02060 [Candidatus Woesearchaeota archaeon]|nr:hypothetical protein [Candidatus Woesearchaeota archaeon]|tara:strand:+ start:18279 stop:18662 length:384 start_codon:yes stop_codon:yes gene_type:complete
MEIRKLTIIVEPKQEFRERIKGYARKIDKGKRGLIAGESISFPSIDVLKQFLTPKRIQLLRIIRNQKPKSLYELAKLSGRKQESVFYDIKLLENSGFIEIEKIKDVRIKTIPKIGYDEVDVRIPIKA